MSRDYVALLAKINELHMLMSNFAVHAIPEKDAVDLKRLHVALSEFQYRQVKG